MKKEKVISLIMNFGLTVLLIVYVFSFSYSIVFATDFETLNNVLSIIEKIIVFGAFIFAIYKYYDGRTKEAQAEIFEEAKSTIEQMIDHIDQLKTGEHSEISNLNLFIAIMTNLGADFKTFYSEITNPAYKRIINIRWQNMNFNHLRVRLSSVDIFYLISNENKINNGFANFNEYAFVLAKGDDQSNDTIDNYNLIKRLEEQRCIDFGEFDSAIHDISDFRDYYLNQDEVYEMMDVANNIIDIRYICPVLAVLDERRRKRFSNY